MSDYVFRVKTVLRLGNMIDMKRTTCRCWTFFAFVIELIPLFFFFFKDNCITVRQTITKPCMIVFQLFSVPSLILSLVHTSSVSFPLWPQSAFMIDRFRSPSVSIIEFLYSSSGLGGNQDFRWWSFAVIVFWRKKIGGCLSKVSKPACSLVFFLVFFLWGDCFFIRDR